MDKLGVLTELVQVADKVIVGGRMAFTFLAQQGVALGRTHVDHELAQQAASILELAAALVCSPPLPSPLCPLSCPKLHMNAPGSTYCSQHNRPYSQPVPQAWY